MQTNSAGQIRADIFRHRGFFFVEVSSRRGLTQHNMQ